MYDAFFHVCLISVFCIIQVSWFLCLHTSTYAWFLISVLTCFHVSWDVWCCIFCACFIYVLCIIQVYTAGHPDLRCYWRQRLSLGAWWFGLTTPRTRITSQFDYVFCWFLCLHLSCDVWCSPPCMLDFGFVSNPSIKGWTSQPAMLLVSNIVLRGMVVWFNNVTYKDYVIVC